MARKIDLSKPPRPRRTAKDKVQKKLLVVMPNSHVHRDVTHTMFCSEFTSYCRAMQQPDYAQLEITIVPDKVVIELKSLKMYLQAFRDTDVYMEELPNWILDDILEIAAPRYCQVKAIYNPRGGIKSEVVVEDVGGCFDCCCE